MSKATRIVSIILMAIPSAMVVLSGVMKLIGSQEMVDGLTKAGFGNYIKLFGSIELISVVLLFYPKTFKIGFLLLCCYLGGAMSIELSAGKFPMAALLLVMLWIGIYLRDKFMFVTSPVLSK